MRTVLIINQLLLLLVITNQVKAQYPRLEITIAVVAESAVDVGDAKIQIAVDGDKPPFVYQLFDKAPWEGGKELSASNKTSESQYIFLNLKNDNYFVCVTDSENNSKCEYIAIKNE
jgi:hypothetical protein